MSKTLTRSPKRPSKHEASENRLDTVSVDAAFDRIRNDRSGRLVTLRVAKRIVANLTTGMGHTLVHLVNARHLGSALGGHAKPVPVRIRVKKYRVATKKK